jgi:hypothetical protein
MLKLAPRGVNVRSQEQAPKMIALGERSRVVLTELDHLRIWSQCYDFGIYNYNAGVVVG